MLCNFSPTFTTSSKAWAWNPEQGCSKGSETFGIVEGIWLGVCRRKFPESKRTIMRYATLVLPLKWWQGRVLEKTKPFLRANIALNFTHGVSCVLQAILYNFASDHIASAALCIQAGAVQAKQWVGFSFRASYSDAQPKEWFWCHVLCRHLLVEKR